ncbi:thioesterase-like superfamily-domain-containing protein [Daldinia caldariorum]|uniref:thioesterase-like superfamily-domain-containing protein n=1 Tax=Daldinia caldariorum TaxID=326644 RepID=UPI0020089C17|nr:thioesterase-like superfamily-domain-containing protein [Daldinia caldariorum]KAI1464550.1 thioesterase-like superfamily-domain-containing protein [Daldinia caldariorum]
MPPRPRAKPTYTLRLLSSGICRQPAPRIKEPPFSSKFSSLTYNQDTAKSDLTSYPSKRWLSELKARIGKCITFGCNREQAQFAAVLLRALTTEWRELVAGAQGYLTGGGRGLENQQVVWGEIDSFGHVNNANYIQYAQSARVNWITHFATVDLENRERWRELMIPKETGLILKSIKARYKFPMTYPDSISAYHKLRFQPSETDGSLVLDCIILSHRHQRVAATTEEDVVFYDYAIAKRTNIPSFALNKLRDVWRKQGEEMYRARARIAELVRSVEGLEKGTWDRKDAVEDLGGAGTNEFKRDAVTTEYPRAPLRTKRDELLIQSIKRHEDWAQSWAQSFAQRVAQTKQDDVKKEEVKLEEVKQEEAKTKEFRKDNSFTNALGRGIRSLF